MTHLKSYWLYYTIALIVIIVIAVNWSKIVGSSSSDTTNQTRITSSVGKKCVCGSPCCACSAGQIYGENIC